MHVWIKEMINLDAFTQVHSFSMAKVLVWGDKDREKREIIREHAIQSFSIPKQSFEWYAFIIKVFRSGTAGPLNVEKVSKLIVDAFSSVIIKKTAPIFPKYNSILRLIYGL